jgi:uncharacterized membrane protein (DUF106 family)
MFARFSTLLLAAVLASPALYEAFVVGDLDVSTALIRYLIAVIVAAVMLSLFRMVVRAYHEMQEKHRREREMEKLQNDMEELRRRHTEGTDQQEAI